MGQKMVQLDLCFPITFKQKRAHECSISSLKQTNSIYQSFKNGYVKNAGKQVGSYGMICIYLFHKQPSVCLLFAVLTAQRLVRLSQ